MMLTAKNFDKALDTLNEACNEIEDVLGDYPEIAEAMQKINDIINFLYECKKEAKNEK